MPPVGQPPQRGVDSVVPGRTDAELVALLVRQRFTGEEWHAVEAILTATAVGVLHDMLLGGSLARKSLALDRPVIPTAEEATALRQNDDDRVDLVHAAVVDGLRIFCALTLEGRGWREDGESHRRASSGPSYTTRRDATPTAAPTAGHERLFAAPEPLPVAGRIPGYGRSR
jgi:hypothetical protein